VDNLTSAIAGIIPPPNMTTDAINQLMHILKQQAKTAKNNATVQRVLKKPAHAERVLTKVEPNPKPATTPSAAPTANPTTNFPDLKIKYPNSDVEQPQHTPVVSQDNHESVSPPSANISHQCRGRTITEDFLFHMMDVPTPTQPFTTQQAALRKSPLQFLCDFASAVLDNKTGDLLEYCHLLKHSKYKDIWSKSLARIFNALQQPPRPLPSWQSKTYPKKDAGTSPTAGLFATILSRKKTPTARISRWEGI
jgi:hypothetical protein